MHDFMLMNNTQTFMQKHTCKKMYKDLYILYKTSRKLLILIDYMAHIDSYHEYVDLYFRPEIS